MKRKKEAPLKNVKRKNAAPLKKNAAPLRDVIRKKEAQSEVVQRKEEVQSEVVKRKKEAQLRNAIRKKEAPLGNAIRKNAEINHVKRDNTVKLRDLDKNQLTRARARATTAEENQLKFLTKRLEASHTRKEDIERLKTAEN